MTDVFISYSHYDGRFAHRLAKSLTQAGVNVWIDIDDIPVGTKWSTAIMQGLKLCEVMIVVISPSGMDSRNVEDEWQYFLDKNKPVIPVLVKPTEIHFQLNRIQRIDFYTEDYDTALQYLFLELETKNVELHTGAIVARPTIIGRRPASLSKKKKRLQRLQTLNLPLILTLGLFVLIVTSSMTFIGLNWREQLTQVATQNAIVGTLNATQQFETNVAVERPVDMTTSISVSNELMSIIANEAVNVRLSDDPGSARMGALQQGQQAKALGINHFKTWYYIEFTGGSGAIRRGWVSAPFVTLNGVESALPELNVNSANALP
jgi:hypothetical protein